LGNLFFFSLPQRTKKRCAKKKEEINEETFGCQIKEKDEV